MEDSEKRPGSGVASQGPGGRGPTAPGMSPVRPGPPGQNAPTPSVPPAGGPATAPGDLPAEDEISVLELANVLLRRWRLVAGLPLAAAFFTAIVSLLVPPTYTATTSFVPESRSSTRLPAGLAGLAGQLGLTLGGEASQSPRFYADVVESRELMERVLLARYPNPRARHNPGDSSTLLRILRVSGDDAADSLHNGVKKLMGLVSSRVDNQTNIVRLSVDARFPQLAAQVANRIVEYLNEFNAKTRQSQARERRRFVEEQVAAAERDLRRAEEELKTFYERNRSWQQSPQLVFEEGRLRRQVEIRQEVYLTLKREYETARIEEVNDTPVITVIDPAVPPQEKSKPKRRLLVMLAVVLGGIVGVLWAFGAEYADRVRREDEGEYREFRGLVQQVRHDVARLAKRVTRRRGRA